VVARTPVFLEKRSYRMRRLMDGARLLPFLGYVVFFLPVLWPHPTVTSSGVIYIFLTWAILIAVCGIISRQLTRAAPAGEADDTKAR